jgi:hypothetical protein
MPNDGFFQIGLLVFGFLVGILGFFATRLLRQLDKMQNDVQKMQTALLKQTIEDGTKASKLKELKRDIAWLEYVTTKRTGELMQNDVAIHRIGQQLCEWPEIDIKISELPPKRRLQDE